MKGVGDCKKLIPVTCFDLPVRRVNIQFCQASKMVTVRIR